jgi:transcription factor SOX9 (SOX group E)
MTHPAHITSDDENISLTSQTLNADGTPKRPMNAFMIFARRRRPQVSAENQSMRTGDVSKVLSREWNAMDMVTYSLHVCDGSSDLLIIQSEKQFYLDQAKHLKDNFNLKYPDYVYRRRPNNSRKKRRADSAGVAGDSASAIDSVDDQSSNPEYGEISPVEYHHDSQERYESSGPEVCTSAEATYDTSYLPPGRASSYQPADSVTYHAHGGNDGRAPYLPSHGRVTPDAVMGPSTPAPRGSTSTAYFSPFVHNTTHAPSASYLPSQSGSEGQWHLSSRSSRDDLARISVQSWSQSGSEQSLHAEDGMHLQYQVSQTPPPSWGASPSEPPASNNPSVHSSSYGFPTLNSPFYPSQSSSHNVYTARQSPSQISDVSHHYGAVDHIQGSSAAPGQEDVYHSHQYSTVSTTPVGYPQSSGSTMHQYHSQSRNILTPAPLAPVQSMPVYSHTPSMNPTSPAGSGTDSASQLQ